MEHVVAKRSIETITAEIILYKQQAGSAILAIGQRLIEAKEQLAHGEWLPWLSKRVEFSETTAQRFMRLAREYNDPALVADLGAAKALLLLALPEEEREAFLHEKHRVDGEEKTALEMSRRELEEALRQRDEARAGATDAESRARLYEERLLEQQKRAQLEKAGAEREKAQLLEQLEELRRKPQQVMIERVLDEDALKKAQETARREAQEVLAKKLETAQRAAQRAQQAQEKAQEDLKALKAAQQGVQETAQKEKQEFEAKVKALQKKLEMASSSEIAVFRLHFEQVQSGLNAMLQSIGRLRNSGDPNGAQKLHAAMEAMLNASMEMLRGAQR